MIRKVIFRGLKVLIIGVVLGATVTAIAVNFIGCAPHNRRGFTNVTVINSGTTAGVPSNLTLTVHNPSVDATNVLLGEVLTELREYEQTNDQSVTVNVEISNEVTNEVKVENRPKVIWVKRPKGKKCRLYHALCKRNKKRCKNRCRRPKPCGND